MSGGERLKALQDAAKAVCPACAGHSFPDDAMPLSGPNSAMNYCHGRQVGGGWDYELCKASSIWSIVAWEWNLKEVSMLSPRGWREDMSS